MNFDIYWIGNFSLHCDLKVSLLSQSRSHIGMEAEKFPQIFIRTTNVFCKSEIQSYLNVKNPIIFSRISEMDHPENK